MTKLIVALLTYFFFSFTLLSAQELQKARYQDRNISVEERIDDLLPQLTLEEKISLLSGAGEFWKR